MAQASKSTISAITIQQAASAIVRMINERPSSPRQEEIEAIVARAVARPAALPVSDIEARLLEAVLECHAAEKALDQAGSGEADIVRYEAARERMVELADQLPTPARSLASIVLRGHVAYLHTDRNKHGTLSWLSSDDYGEVAAAKLVAAVLQFAGDDLRRSCR